MDEPGRFGNLKRAQKILLGSLYFLIILMIIFSLLAAWNTGEKGYKQCVQQKCDQKGEQFCSKARELANCCSGAGGTLSTVSNPDQGESPYTCLFN